jgi:putative membrane protein
VAVSPGVVLVGARHQRLAGKAREHLNCTAGGKIFRDRLERRVQMEAAMRQWIGVVALACVVAAAPTLASQTPAGSGQGQGTPPKGGTIPKPSGTATGHEHPAGSQGASAGADAMFARTAAMDGMAEVEHGRLAAQNATHDEVKQFGQRMVDDHGKAGDELKSLASKKNVTLPTELDAKHKAMHDKLAKMKGDAFDRAYMSHMVTDHQQAVALFGKEAKGGKDADVKAWAEKTLPTLQEHLKMARSVNAKVSAGGKTPPDASKKPPQTPKK